MSKKPRVAFNPLAGLGITDGKGTQEKEDAKDRKDIKDPKGTKDPKGNKEIKGNKDKKDITSATNGQEDRKDIQGNKDFTSDEGSQPEQRNKDVTSVPRRAKVNKGKKGNTSTSERAEKIRFTVLLREDLIDRLRDLAVHEYRTLADIAEDAFADYLKKAGEIPPRRGRLKTGRPIGRTG